MNKNQIEEIFIKKRIDFFVVLELSIKANGQIQRRGDAELPSKRTVVNGMADPVIFSQLINSLDERIFHLSDVYDSPDKPGKLVVYTIRFLGKKPPHLDFQFYVGSESEKVGDLLPYLQAFISRALVLTDDWYATGITNLLEYKQSENYAVPKKPWYRFW
jgi:hypothetical protein